MSTVQNDAAQPSRQLVASMFLTLDGVMESPEKWQFPYYNEEMGAAISAGLAGTDTLLMGGTLYREWSQHWPVQQGEVAEQFNSTPKYVLSDSLDDHLEWANSTVIRGNEAADRIRQLKAGPGQSITVSGSATVVRWLLAEQLVEELNLLVCPVLLGKGRRLFDETTPPVSLELVSSRAFGTGVLHSTYRPLP